MNRSVAVALAVGVAFGLAAVSGAVAFDNASPFAADAPANSSQSVDGTQLSTGSANDTLVLRSGASQEISGQTDLDAGTTLSVRMQSVNSTSSPFLRTAEATVSEDGTFSATVDLARVADGTGFRVTVRHDGETVANATGEVRSDGEPAPEPEPAPDPDSEPVEESADDGSESDGLPRHGTEFVVDGDQLTLEAAPAAHIEGETDLEAGTTVSVRLRSANNASPFLRADETTVTEDGTFSLAFNLSTIEPGAEFEASARANGEELARQSGTVAECTSDCDPQRVSTTADESDESGGTDDQQSVSRDSSWLTTPAVHVEQGNTASLPISLEDGADAVTVVVGGDSVNYEVSATVRDANGDGQVTVTFDTAAAGTDEPTLSVGDGDEIERHDESRLPATIDPASYPVTVHRGASADGEQVDQGTLSVTECSADCPTDDQRSDDGADEQADDDWPDDEWLGESIVHTYSGQTALLPLNLDTGTEVPDAATVVIGSEDVNYRIEATVTDENDDGRVALEFDTSTAGLDNATLSVGDGDDRTVTEETSLSSTLDPGNYDISVYRGTDTDDDPVDIGTLAISEAHEDA